ncbi:hypothetical protein NDU88_003140 [Pleurodeles waltl]|uniref:Uncharacterized protein n=1 Tax=Pleurodeles waltl TaxID=8319 RepID=A0AAV7PB98_PLEWA|nr:hypothetical protein NDU88_003140 [Pleurodeles waltl]
MYQKRGAKERDICVGDMVLVKCRKGGSKFLLPFEKDPWVVSDVKGTMITAKRGPESITQNISFYKKVYASDFPVPIDVSSEDQDYDDVMLQSSGVETNGVFLDGGLSIDVQNPGGSMELDHGSGDRWVEESIASGSGQFLRLCTGSGIGAQCPGARCGAEPGVQLMKLLLGGRQCTLVPVCTREWCGRTSEVLWRRHCALLFKEGTHLEEESPVSLGLREAISSYLFMTEGQN